MIDHQPKGRHKRFDADVLRSLESLAQGSPADILSEAAIALHIAPVKEIFAKSRLDRSTAEEAWGELVQQKRVILLENTGSDDSLSASSSYWNSLHPNISRLVEGYHAQYPLRRGIPREELKSKLKLAPKIFNVVLAYLNSLNALVDQRGAVSMPGHEIKFNGREQATVEALRRRFSSNPYVTPSIKECQTEAGEEMVNALIEMGELMPVSQEVIFRKSDYDKMIEKVKSAIGENGKVTLAEVRDMFGTTRKYVQALLEHMDAIGETIRDGDARKLRK